MSEQFIICPNCETEIALSDALSEQFEEKIQSRLKSELSKKEKDFALRMKEIEARDKKVTQIKENMDAEIEAKVNEERTKIKESEEENAKKKVSLEIQDLKTELEEKNEELEEAQKNELKLRERERKLESDKRAFELKMKRQLGEEKDKMEKDIKEALSQEYILQIGDYQKKIDSMTQQINDLKQKAEQGSQQAQGEVLELKLEEILKDQFPYDNIIPVSKGARGADVIHEIYNDSGNLCGKILWESKRTKTWSNKWIDKLKEDQRKEKAEIAVILSLALPNDINGFQMVDGIWITEYKSLLGLATALRLNLIELDKTRVANIGKGQKVDMLYNYLSGPEFKGRVESIVEVFKVLSSDLESERIAITKMWAKREKQIQKMIEDTAGMYGDLQGIIGASIPEIENMNILALPEANNYIK